jgi:hypothetical protein
MPFVTARRPFNDSNKWDVVRGNDTFVLEKKSRRLQRTLFRIRLVVLGNNLVLFESDSRADAMKEFEDLNNPRLF